MINDKLILLQKVFITITLERNKDLIRYTFNEAADYVNVTEEVYRELICFYVEACKKYKCSRLLLDMYNAHFTMPEDTQAWTLQTINEKVRDVKKVAVIMGQDISAKISVEPMVVKSGVYGSIQEIRLFENLADAEQWI